jgi:hypothetical protein
MLNTLDFEALDTVTGRKISEVAHDLFAAIKKIPLGLRTEFPEILKNNNFGLSVRVTRTHAFLEISPKSKAVSSKDRERVGAYRKLFTSIDSGKAAVLRMEDARLSSVAKVSLNGAYAIALGSNISLCLWEIQSLNPYFPGKEGATKIDLLYIVGYGQRVPKETAWQEFDAMIRTTISQWHRGR